VRLARAGRSDYSNGLRTRATFGGVVELLFGDSLIVVETSGWNAGRSKLTEMERKILEGYRATESVAAAAAERALNDLILLTVEKITDDSKRDL
jgi:molybdenum-dependent DNA-binding transcriptional regulator ModE